MTDEGRIQDLDVADAVVCGVEIGAACVTVRLKDWREADARMVFRNALMVQDWGIVEEALSHIVEVTSDPSVAAACERAGERATEYSAYKVFGAWDDRPIFIVVAASATVESDPS